MRRRPVRSREWNFRLFPSLEFSNCYVDNIDTKTNNINDKHSLIVLIKCRMGFGNLIFIQRLTAVKHIPCVLMLVKFNILVFDPIYFKNVLYLYVTIFI